MAKTNDWFAARLFQPQMTAEELYANGVTPENSELKNKDDYRNIPAVIDKFTVNGVFNDKSFNDFYDMSLSLYNEFAKTDFEKTLINQYESDPYEWWSLGNKEKDVAAKYFLENNPTKESISISGLKLETEPRYSIREIAQNVVARDQDGNSLGWTPNEKGGLFKSLSRPDLVLAQYDEDSVEILPNGNKVEHKKGEYKLHDGAPYYELLGDREAYGKILLNWNDTIIPDEDAENKWGVFNNDGLKKSAGATAIKTVFTMAPLLIPYVGNVYGTVRIIKAVSQLLPVLGKTINGSIFGTNKNDIGKFLTKVENYTSRFNSSVSDYSLEHPWSFENLGELVNQVGGQLFEQRLISQIPGFINIGGSAAKNIKFGQDAALAYMATTSAQQTYSSFKQAGANDRTAGIAMIANVFALWKLMDIDYFRNSLLKGTYMDENVIKAPAWRVAKTVEKDLTDKTITSTPEASKNFFKKIVNLYDRSIKTGWETVKTKKTPFSGILSRMANEGTEEVMEEVTSDLSKTFTLGLNAIGIPVAEKNKNLDFGFSPSEIASRYAITFLGGAVGGGIFHLQGAWEGKLDEWKHGYVANQDQSDLEQLTWYVAQGRENEIRNYYDQWYKKGWLGSKDLSGSKFEISNVPGEKGTILFESSTDGDLSQNDVVYKALVQQLDYVKEMLQEEGFVKFANKILANEGKDISNEQSAFAKATLLSQFGLNDIVLKDINSLAAQVVGLKAKLATKWDSYKSGDQADDKAKQKAKFDADFEVQQMLSRLTELRKKRDDILAGKRNDFYVTQGLLSLDTETLQHFSKINTKDDFCIESYGSDYASLTDEQKVIADEEYKIFEDKNEDAKLKVADIYTKLSERYSNKINELIKKFSNTSSDQLHEDELIGFKWLKDYQDLISNREKLKSLLQKESLSDEEEKTKKELETKIIELSSNIIKLKNNPNLFLQFDFDKQTGFDKINQEILDAANPSNEDFVKVGKLIKSLYNTYATNKVLVPNDAELNGFYNWVRKSWSDISPEKRLENYINDWYEVNIVDKGLDSDYASDEFLNQLSEKDKEKYKDRVLEEGVWSQSSTKTKDVIINLLNKFNQTFGNNNKEALEIYDNLLNYLPEDIIKDLLPHIGDESIIDYIKEIDGIRKNINYSEFTNLFNEFYVDLTGEKSSIIDALNYEEKRLASMESVTDYTLNNKASRNALTNLSNVLDVFIGILNGAYSGLNADINKYREKLDKSLLPVFDEKTKNLLYKDAEKLMSKTLFLLNLDTINGSQKLKLQEKIAINMRPKFIESIINPIISAPFKKEFTNETKSIDLAEIWNSINTDSKNINAIDQSNFSEYEKLFISFESKVFEEVRSLGFNDSVIADKLTNVFGDNITSNISTNLTSDENEKIENYDKLIYLASVISVPSNDFYSATSEINDKMEFAPIFGQEFAVRIAHSFLVRPDLFNRITFNIKQKLNVSDDEYIKNKPSLMNFIFISGGAGTGKTTAIAKTLYEILNLNDKERAEFIYLAPNKTQVENLVKNIGVDANKATRFTKDEIFKIITTDKNGIDNSNVEINKKTYHFEEKNLALSDRSIFQTSDKIKILLVDEVACFNEVELKLLSQYAFRNNIFVVGMGDQKQTAADVNNYPSGLEDTVHIKTPTLSVPLRSGNIGKIENYNNLNVLLSNAIKEMQLNPSWKLSDINEYVRKITSDTNRTLIYADNTDGVFGEKVVESKNELIKEIERFKDKGTIAIISDSKETYNKYIDDKKIQWINPQNANGGEFDYVFVDTNWKSPDGKTSIGEFKMLRNLYTITQRSRIATIMINNGLFGEKVSPLGLSNSINSSAENILRLSDTDLNDYKKWRSVGISNLTPSASFEDYMYPDLDLPTPKSLNEVPDLTTKKQSTGDAPSTNSESTDHKKEEQSENENEQNRNNPVTSTKPNQAETPVETTTKTSEENPKEAPVKVSVETPTSENVQDEEPPIIISTPTEPVVESEKPMDQDVHSQIDEIPNDAKYENKQSSILELKKIIDDYKARKIPVIANADFYEYIYNPSSSFISDERNRDTSLLKYIDESGVFSNEAYRKIVHYVSSLVQNNKNLKDNQYLSRFISLLYASTSSQKTMSKITKLKNNIASSTTEIELKINNKGIMFLNIMLGNLNNIDIPVAVTNFPEGKYTGKFKILNPIQYIKDDKKRITISELIKKFPWLNVSNMGILSVNKNQIDEIRNSTNYSEDTKKFLLENNNNGKPFIIIDSNVSLTSEDSNNLWSLGKSEDANNKDWAYKNHDREVLIGLQKRIDLYEAIKYATAITLRGYTNFKRFFDSNEVNNPKEWLKQELNLDYDDENILKNSDIYNLLGQKDFVQSIISTANNSLETYKKLENSNIQVVPTNRSGILLSSLIGGKTDEIKEKLLSSVWDFLHTQSSAAPTGKGYEYYNGMFININNNFYFIDYNKNSNNYDIYLFDMDTFSKKTINPVYSVNANKSGIFKIDIMSILNQLRTMNDISQSENIDPNIEKMWLVKHIIKHTGAEIRDFYNIQCANFTLSYIFKKVSNLASINEWFNNTEFKDMIFANDPAGNFIPGSTWFRNSITNKGTYTTDTVELYPEIYSINPDEFIPGNNNRINAVNEEENIFNDEIEVLKNTLQKNEIYYNFDDNLFKFDYTLNNAMDQIGNILNEINKSFIDNKNTKEIKRNEEGEYEIVNLISKDDKVSKDSIANKDKIYTMLISSIQKNKEFFKDPNAINSLTENDIDVKKYNITWKYIIFSLSSPSNNGLYMIYEDKKGQYIKNIDEKYLNIVNFLNQNNFKDVEEYINTLETHKTTSKNVNKYIQFVNANSKNPEVVKLIDMVNDYLMQRLQNNEC